MPKINQEEYEILKGLDNQWKWISRDSNTSLWAYEKEPRKHEDFWGEFNGGFGIAAINLFQFIQWEDENPYSIAELIEDYEKEVEESEVKKDKEWLNNEVEELEGYGK